MSAAHVAGEQHSESPRLAASQPPHHIRHSQQIPCIDGCLPQNRFSVIIHCALDASGTSSQTSIISALDLRASVSPAVPDRARRHTIIKSGSLMHICMVIWFLRRERGGRWLLVARQDPSNPLTLAT